MFDTADNFDVFQRPSHRTQSRVNSTTTGSRTFKDSSLVARGLMRASTRTSATATATRSVRSPLFNFHPYSDNNNIGFGHQGLFKIRWNLISGKGYGDSSHTRFSECHRDRKGSERQGEVSTTCINRHSYLCN